MGTQWQPTVGARVRFWRRGDQLEGTVVALELIGTEFGTGPRKRRHMAVVHYQVGNQRFARRCEFAELAPVDPQRSLFGQGGDRG